MPSYDLRFDSLELDGSSFPSYGLVSHIVADDAVGAEGSRITSWPARVGPVMSSTLENPYKISRAYGPYSGVKFAGADAAEFVDASLRITGDVSMYVFASQWLKQHTASIAWLLSLGDVLDTAENENMLYSMKIASGVTNLWWESSHGVYVSPTITLTELNTPGVVGYRRDATAKVVKACIGTEQFTSAAYTNNATDGAVSSLWLGASGTTQHLIGGMAEVMIYDRLLTDAEHDSVVAYLEAKYQQRTFSLGLQTLAWQPATSNDHQAGVSNGTHIWAVNANRLGKYTVAGAELENVLENPGLTSWGGAELYNSRLYCLRYHATTDNAIYSYDPDDLAAAPVLEKTLDDVPAGLNGLLRMTDGRWLVGETNIGGFDQPIRMYILASSFAFEKTVDVGIVGTTGIQSFTQIGDDIYFSLHGSTTGTVIVRGRFDTNDDFYVDWTDITPHNIGGMAYDSTNGLWMFGRGTNGPMRLHGNFNAGLSALESLPGLLTWWQADDLVNSSDNASISSWTDRISGHVLTGTGTDPTYDTKNAMPVNSIDFTSSTGLSEEASDMRVLCPGANEAFIVGFTVNITDISNNSILGVCGAGGTTTYGAMTGWQVEMSSAGTMQLKMKSGSLYTANVAGVLANGTDHVVVACREHGSNTLHLWVDGNYGSVTASGSLDFKHASVFADFNMSSTTNGSTAWSIPGFNSDYLIGVQATDYTNANVNTLGSELAAIVGSTWTPATQMVG